MATPAKESTAPTSDQTSFDPNQLEAMASRSKNEEFANKVISWTKSSHVRCRSMRQQLERQWYINMAYYIGRQNVMTIPVNQGNSSGTRLYTPPVPYYRSRPVFNRIRPAIRTELSKLTSQKPSASIVPATGEDQDLAAAQAGEQVWDSIYRDKKIKSIFRQACFWSLITGTGYMKTYWNPSKTDEDGSKGDFCYENVTPFHIFVSDLLCEDIEDQPYVIHIQTRSIEWVRMKYPDLNVQPNVMEADDILSEAFLSLVGANDMRRRGVLIYEVWVKPGHVSFMPDGGMFTIVGDNLVQFVDHNPYDHQQYPFTKFPHLPTGRYYADSTINDLLPVQREYNRTRGQIIESKNRMAHPQLLAAQGSIVASKITTEPGQVIFYKLGYPPPTPLTLQNIPAYVMQEVDRLLMDFEDISGQHQVSKGQAPPGVTAATAISYLQEQDDSMLSTTYAAIEEGFEKIAFQTLCYVKQYWNIPRMVKVVGRDGQFNVLAFKGSDLRDNTDIRIEAGSALPTSKSAKQALLMDLMTQGFIPPEKGLELMEVGGVQRLYEEVQIDSAQASRENMRMAAVDQDMLDEYLQTFIAQPPPQPDMGMGPGGMGGLAALLSGAGGQPQSDMSQGQPMLPGMPPGGMSQPPGGMQPPDMPGMPGEMPPEGMPPEIPGAEDANDPMEPMQDQTLQMAQGGQDDQGGPPTPQLIDPNTGGPLVDQAGNPTAPPLIVPVNSFDNHQAHISVHNNYRKSQQYEGLAPEIKNLFEEHVNQHMKMLGMIPGQPAPGAGANPVSSGGAQAGQISPEMLQQVIGGAPGQPGQGGQQSPPPPGGQSPPGGPPGPSDQSGQSQPPGGM